MWAERFAIPPVNLLELVRVEAGQDQQIELISDAPVYRLRGEIVTALDMRRRLGLDDRPAGELPHNVAVRTSDGAISLLVDEIGDVIEARPESFEKPPESIDVKHRELLDGMYKLDGELLLALSTETVLDLSPSAA